MRKATGRYRTHSSLVKLQPRFLSLQEDLPLVRIAALVPEFAVKDLPLGRTPMMMMMMVMMIVSIIKIPKAPLTRFLFSMDILSSGNDLNFHATYFN